MWGLPSLLRGVTDFTVTHDTSLSKETKSPFILGGNVSKSTMHFSSVAVYILQIRTCPLTDSSFYFSAFSNKKPTPSVFEGNMTDCISNRTKWKQSCVSKLAMALLGNTLKCSMAQRRRRTAIQSHNFCLAF